MSTLAQKKCVPCEGGVAPLTAAEVASLIKGLKDWVLVDGKLCKTYEVPQLSATMAFVNATAWISHREDHHPDLTVGYSKCRLTTSPTPSAACQKTISSAPQRSTPCLSYYDGIIRGLIVAAYGRRFLVECADGITRDCVTRGKRTDFACGDDVAIAVQNESQGAINNCAPRKSLLYRSDQWKQKLIAANVTQVVIVVAPVP